jgi:hypothetical protein
VRPYLEKKKNHKKGLVEWLQVQALSSNSMKRERERERCSHSFLEEVEKEQLGDQGRPGRTNRDREEPPRHLHHRGMVEVAGEE